MGQKGFFDLERRLEAISSKGDPLEFDQEDCAMGGFPRRHRGSDGEGARGAQEQRRPHSPSGIKAVPDRGHTLARAAAPLVQLRQKSHEIGHCSRCP
jgi:hypothetical protein